MTRKRQPAPRPSTRVPVSEEKLAELGREAEQRLQRAKRQSDLTAHLKTIAGVYQTYHRVHSDEDAAFRAQLPTEDDWAKSSAEFNRWLDGDRRTAAPPGPSFPPIPRLLHELGTERERIEVELAELERLPGLGMGRRRIEVTLKGTPENEMEDAMLRILVEQGWSSPQIAAALDPDGGKRKTYELKAEMKRGRQAVCANDCARGYAKSSSAFKKCACSTSNGSDKSARRPQRPSSIG